MLAAPPIPPVSGLRRSFPSRALALLFVATLFFALTAQAGRYELVKIDDPQENYQFADVNGVCVAYEENLKRFEHLPYGMACERQLDPKLGFTRPRWQKFDVMQHAVLVRNIFRFLHWDKNLASDSRSWEEQLREMIVPHKPGGRYPLVMELTQVDLNHDGKLENIVRIGIEHPCDLKEAFRQGIPDKGLVVVDSGLGKINEDFSRDLFQTSGDVFLYRGIAYSDKFYAAKGGYLSLHSIYARGPGPECRYDYYGSGLDK